MKNPTIATSPSQPAKGRLSARCELLDACPESERHCFARQAMALIEPLLPPPVALTSTARHSANQARWRANGRRCVDRDVDRSVYTQVYTPVYNGSTDGSTAIDDWPGTATVKSATCDASSGVFSCGEREGEGGGIEARRQAKKEQEQELTPQYDLPVALTREGEQAEKPKTRKKKTAAPGVSEEMQGVWAHYMAYRKALQPRTLDILDKKDAGYISARLKEGWTSDDLKIAIQALFDSPFHTGDNGSGASYCLLYHAIGTREKVQRFIDNAAATDRSPRVAEGAQ